jgi:hypothetical protein
MLTRRIRTDGFVDPCIPTRATKAPAGTGWVHEIKHDGYRLNRAPGWPRGTPIHPTLSAADIPNTTFART